MNPMIRKELRQRMRERRGWLLPSLYLLGLGAVVALAYYGATDIGKQTGTEPQGAAIGATVFLTVTYAQLALLLILAPVFSAGTITLEKEQRTLPSLLTSLLSAPQIWWGKFIASLLFLCLLLISALPVLSLTFALGGVSPGDLIAATGMTLLMLAAICTIGLYCSSFFRRSVHSTAVTYGVIILLTVVTGVVYGILEWSWSSGQGQVPGAGEAPGYIAAPLYLNPFYAVTLAFRRHEAGFPDWAISAMLFAGMAIWAAAFAMRNIERSGEQS